MATPSESERRLADIIDDGPLPLDQIAALVEQIAQTLDAQTQRGAVHGAVSPTSVLVDDDGHAVLIPHETGDGPAYASPEQLQALPVDGRADQYSLACTAFTLLTGVPPYALPTDSATIIAHASAPIPALSTRRPGLDPALDHIFYRALAKNPADRFATSSEFAATLGHALRGAPRPQPATAPPPPTPPPPTPPLPLYGTAAYSPPPKKKVGRIVLMVSVLLVVVVLVAGGVYWLTRPDDGPDKESRTAFDATASVTVSPEAATLRRQSVTPNLPSLASRPDGPRWEWNPAGDPDMVEIIGGTDRYALGAAYFRNRDRTVFAVLDVQTGRVVHEKSVRVLGKPGRPVDCTAFRDTQTLFCLVSDNVAEDSPEPVYAVIDLEKGAATDPIVVDGYPTGIFATGDRMVVTTDGGTVAFDTDGRQVWRDTELHPGHVAIPQGSPVVDNGGGRSGEPLILHSATDGRVVHRSTPPGYQYAPWAPFLDGFMVSRDGGVDFFDAKGTSTATLDGWWPVGYDDRFNTVTALPIVYNKTSIAAVNPETGTILWERPNGVFAHSGGVGSLVVIPPDRDDPSRLPGYWLDVYTGVGGSFVFSELFAGTDGTRLATTGKFGTGAGLTVFAPDGGQPWDLAVEPDPSYFYTILGGHVYVHNRQIL